MKRIFCTSLAIGLIPILLSPKQQYQTQRVKKIISIACIGIITSIYYWFNFWQFYNLPQYSDIVARISPEMSHKFRFSTVWKSYVRDIVLVVALWFLFFRKSKVLVIFLAGFLLSYFVVVNMQVVTGFNPQPDHWYRTQFLAVALSIFMIFYWMYERYSPKLVKRHTIKILFVFLAFIFLGNIYSEYIYSESNAEKYIIPYSVSGRYAWLNENTPKWSVIGTLSPEIARGISIHTHNKLFLPVGSDIAASEKEVWDRLMILSKIFHVNTESFSSFIQNEENLLYFFSHRFDTDTSFDTAFRGQSCCKLPTDVYGNKILDYVLVDKNFLDIEIPYQLDYLWIEHKERQLISDFSIVKDYKKVYDDGEVSIYQI